MGVHRSIEWDQRDNVCSKKKNRINESFQTRDNKKLIFANTSHYYAYYTHVRHTQFEAEGSHALGCNKKRR